jgi:SPX domain protein involved in polyphosphate accumulation
MRFWRGQRAPAEPASVATRPPEPRMEAGHALRAPSRLHAFNRYEMKYLVPRELLADLRDELRQRMDVDSYAAAGGYGVWSVYYDTAALRFYWEKIEGLRFRRKIRIRHYGDRFGVTDDTPVFVEIKQRVNRVTQKRRVRVPYRQARQLCDERRMIEYDGSGLGFLEEVLGLICGLDLRPIGMTGYSREAYIGRDAEVGLRVTLDHRVRGRDRDFHFGSDSENRLIIPPRLAVLEVKANERVPYWLTDLTAKRNLSMVRVSKYCQSVEVFGKAPRSAFHTSGLEN